MLNMKKTAKFALKTLSKEKIIANRGLSSHLIFLLSSMRRCHSIVAAGKCLHLKTFLLSLSSFKQTFKNGRQRLVKSLLFWCARTPQSSSFRISNVHVYAYHLPQCFCYISLHIVILVRSPSSSSNRTAKCTHKFISFSYFFETWLHRTSSAEFLELSILVLFCIFALALSYPSSITVH